jgi:hypothetical protein
MVHHLSEAHQPSRLHHASCAFSQQQNIVWHLERALVDRLTQAKLAFGGKDVVDELRAGVKAMESSRIILNLYGKVPDVLGKLER